MPANSLLGQRAILVDLIATAVYSYSEADTYAACSQIPGGGVGTTLQLPSNPGSGDYFAWADTDNSCSAASPIIVLPAAGNTISGLASLVNSTPGTAGEAVFDSATNNWFVFQSGATSGGGGGADLLGEYTIVATTVPVLSAVKVSAADTAAKAQANAAANAAIGIVKALLTATKAEVVYGGELGGFVGLVAGSTYYLDPAVAGGITAVAPTTIGQIVQTVGFAKDATTLIVAPGRLIQL